MKMISHHMPPTQGNFGADFVTALTRENAL
jgi:hypothetical protein